MARDPEHRADSFETENTGGLLTGFLADEDDFDRRALWRLGSWAAASVGAVIVAVLASQSSMGWRRNQVATDQARQAQQIQLAAKETLKESLNETRRLASAIDTLNGDRDRLYSRITVLEQGLESVTGSIARQNSAAASPQAAAAAEPAPAPQNPSAPAVSAVATTAAASAETPPAGAAPAADPGPATVSSVAQGSANETPAAMPSPPLMASKSMLAPPDSAPAKLIEAETPAKGITKAPMPPVVASATPPQDAEPDASSPKLVVQRTEFGVDVGGANSVAGLRALWRGLLKSRSNAALTTLRPIIVVKEATNGLGMQLRLVAGPLDDAAAAAKICAALVESKRTCETAVFEGQRLAIKAEEAPAAARPAPRRPSPAKRSAAEEPKKPEPSMLSTVFGNR